MDNAEFVLYKFRAIDERLVESLIDQTLYFATPDKLNDPFDCRIDLQRVFRRAEMLATGERRDFLSSFVDNPEFFRNWRSTLDAMGVCCFSRRIEETLQRPSYAETLLWSHYAKEHRGVRLEYQFRGASLKGDIVTAQDVEYLDDPLVPWLVENAPTDMLGFVKELVLRYLRTKCPAWKYEKEARIIRRASGPFRLRGVLLTEVCFGLRTPQADVDRVTKLAQNCCRGVKFFHMVRDETEFRFVKEAL